MKEPNKGQHFYSRIKKFDNGKVAIYLDLNRVYNSKGQVEEEWYDLTSVVENTIGGFHWGIPMMYISLTIERWINQAKEEFE